jgi:hypothetical protein
MCSRNILPSSLMVLMLVSAVMTLAGPTKAQVVTGFFREDNGIFHYAFRVFNNTAEELDYVSLYVDNLTFDVTNLAAPKGFAVQDGGIVGTAHYVNFVQDLDDTTPQSFAPNTTVEFFRFYSTADLGSPTVEVSSGGGTTITTNTITPFASAPEPTSIALLALPIASIPVLRYRKRFLR